MPVNPDPAPGIPVVTLGTTDDDSVVVGWTKPSGVIIGYEIEVRKVSTNTLVKEVTVIGANSRSKTVTGLQSETRYAFNVYAYNNDNDGDLSDTKYKTTLKTPVTPPSTKTVPGAVRA